MCIGACRVVMLVSFALLELFLIRLILYLTILILLWLVKLKGLRVKGMRVGAFRLNQLGYLLRCIRCLVALMGMLAMMIFIRIRRVFVVIRRILLMSVDIQVLLLTFGLLGAVFLFTFSASLGVLVQNREILYDYYSLVC